MKRRPSSQQRLHRLKALEAELEARGMQVHYDLLECAGLRLEGGVCRHGGACHLYVDRRKTTAERIRLLEQHLARPSAAEAPAS